jgi:UDP-N-acetylmuramoyl-tripeptide--D-alanyl-D-alanine ligase
MATPIPQNHCRFTAEEIVEATGARFSAPSSYVTGVSIDSRTITHDALFVALRGVRDGHDYIPDAAARGAAAAIVESGRASDLLPCFEVHDTLAALGALAHFHLERCRTARSLPVITIGGAAGKTTTKELTAALARALYGEVLATSGNLNNLIGVPMTLLTLTDAHRAAVIECGTNSRGEIERLGAIVSPDAALVLNVDIEHTEGLGSLDGVADEEAAIFGNARIAVIDAAEHMLVTRIPPTMRTMRFGGADTPGADIRLLRREIIGNGRQRISLSLPPSSVEREVEPSLDATLNLVGASSARNAAAAVAAMAALCSKPWSRRELELMAAALEEVFPVPGRLAAIEIGRVLVLDDTYNANPRSVRAAIEAAREVADGLGARLVVALGDMLELGDLAPAMHSQVLWEVLAMRPGALFTAGPQFAAALSGLGSEHRNISITQAAADSAAVARLVQRVVKPGDVLLVKGSRGLAMERVIAALADPV